MQWAVAFAPAARLVSVSLMVLGLGFKVQAKVPAILHFLAPLFSFVRLCCMSACVCSDLTIHCYLGSSYNTQ